MRGYLANAEKVRVRGRRVRRQRERRPAISRCYGAPRTPTASYVSFPDAPPPLEDTGGAAGEGHLRLASAGHLEVGGVVRRRGTRRRGTVIRAVGEILRRRSTPATARGSRRARHASQYLCVDGYSLVNARVGFRAAKWTV